MKKKILVTGASGYIGRSLAEHLCERGYEITGTYRTKYGRSRFHSVKIDLSQPFDIDKDFDVIIHAAGECPVRSSELWQYDTQEFNSFKHNNVDSVENMLAFARAHNVKKIIYLSSIGIYGEMRDLVINEKSDRINPDTYGVTKYMGEILLRECPDVQSISLRMPGVIGLDVKKGGGTWLSNIVEKIKNGENVTIYNPDFQTPNFVWINDLSNFVEHLIGLDEWKYDTLVLACKESASVKQIIDRIMCLTKSTSKIHIDNSLRRSFRLDASKAFEMGYESITPLEIVENLLS